MTSLLNSLDLLAHVPKVRGYDPTPSGLAEALKGAEIVLIPAGVPRKPGMTRDGTNRITQDSSTCG